MSYDEFKQLSKKNWEEEYIYLCIDRCKKKIKEHIGFLMKAKTLLQNLLRNRHLFDQHKCCVQ